MFFIIVFSQYLADYFLSHYFGLGQVKTISGPSAAARGPSAAARVG